MPRQTTARSITAPPATAPPPIFSPAFFFARPAPPRTTLPSSHLCAVMFMRATGTTMTHVPFRATPDEMNAMIGGHIDLAIDSMTTIWPLAKAGEIRALGVSTPQRVATAPDLPTIGETVTGFAAT